MQISHNLGSEEKNCSQGAADVRKLESALFTFFWL
jgi:hypothetical protein